MAALCICGQHLCLASVLICGEEFFNKSGGHAASPKAFKQYMKLALILWGLHGVTLEEMKIDKKLELGVDTKKLKDWKRKECGKEG